MVHQVVAIGTVDRQDRVGAVSGDGLMEAGKRWCFGL